MVLLKHCFMFIARKKRFYGFNEKHDFEIFLGNEIFMDLEKMLIYGFGQETRFYVGEKT